MPRVDIKLEGNYFLELKNHKELLVRKLAQIDIFRIFCECEHMHTLGMDILGYYVALHKNRYTNILTIRAGEKRK